MSKQHSGMDWLHDAKNFLKKIQVCILHRRIKGISVILNKEEYENKMVALLDDEVYFPKTTDPTLALERRNNTL